MRSDLQPAGLKSNPDFVQENTYGLETSSHL